MVTIVVAGGRARLLVLSASDEVDAGSGGGEWELRGLGMLQIFVSTPGKGGYEGAPQWRRSGICDRC